MYKRTRDYAKDYERSGNTARYIGKHYRLNLPQPELKKRKLIYLLSLVAAAGLFVSLGLLGSAAFGGAGKQAAFYVVLPYVGLLLPLGLALSRALLLVVKARPMEFAEYDKYLVQQKGALVAALALAGALALGQVAFLLFGGVVASWQELAALGTIMLCIGCIFTAFQQHHALFQCVTIDELTGVRYDT